MVTSVYYDLSALKERLRGKQCFSAVPQVLGKQSGKGSWKDASVRVGDISKLVAVSTLPVG